MKLKLFFFIFFIFTYFGARSQDIPITISNPVLPGFNPDPSICRVNDDYYMVTSSFTWYPGIPIYHSKDLVNWEVIGHGINRPEMIDMNGLDDNNGIWAVTIRHHDGLFYLITTANKSGGNFYITATDPKGPWSDPIWLKDATGIDPSLFWDDDGKCYYTGNSWDFKKSWPAQCAIWMQELDLSQGKLIGERRILTYGHANNATYAEGPHIYKIDGKYMLLMAEGGSSYHHAITVHHSKSLWGPYVADKTNPVLTHRHLGSKCPLQALGHADLVQTQNGDWYSIFLGKRMIKDYNPLARETFMCKVEFEGTTPIFNPSIGMIRSKMERPNLPWTPIQSAPARDEFTSSELDSKWYFVRIPQKTFHNLENGQLTLSLQSEVADSLVNSAMIIQKTKHHKFQAITQLKFQTKKDNEQAGLIYYRTANGYYSLLKDKKGIALIKKHLGKKEIIEHIPYNKPEVYLAVKVDGLDVHFSFGETLDGMTNIGGNQSIEPISDNKFNKFNGPGIGVYATSNGKPSRNKAIYDWFEYKAK
ncbi:glycoside hydrolase family 43 protein [Bacteroides oleiciplenus]|uniref:glycoside hydrolase family 43 protein n=1 Tax=Bacteroides oleiciplenus TaxID=626931 RepID=UPI0026DC6C92|nr:glycoside hydrolase family 43 protein [Bacteroides oleiciplenus]